MANNLPQGWVECELKDFANIIMGQSPASSTYNEEKIGFPFFQGKAEFGKDYPIIKKWCSRPTKIANKGDILLSVRAPVGTTNICIEKACIGRGLSAIRGYGDIDNKFIRYLLMKFEYKMHLVSTGTTFKAISGGNLKSLKLPLPPLNEQKRIVEKIENEFEKIDEGIEKLKLVQEQINQYKQSVLKSAFEGKLYKTTEWEETTLENVSIKITDGSHFSPKTIENGGYPYVTVKNVNDDEIDFENCKYISQKDYDELVKNGCKPLLNDVLFSKDGTVGKVTLIDYEREFVILSSLAIIRPDVEKILPQYLKWALKNPRFLQEATNKKTGVAIRRIILATLRKLQVRYPKPIAVQQKIVEEIEKRFEVADNVAKIIEENLEKAEQLKQSILKKAFEGRLVPQDLTDEPASVLLERIKKEREK